MTGRRLGTGRRLLPYGEHGLLVECADLEDTLGLLAALQQDRPAQVTEIVPGARSVLLHLDAPLPQAHAEALLTATAAPVGAADAAPIEIAVHYDGADLADVAELTGLSPAQVVAAHTGQLWTLAFCGFAPGFGYLVGDGSLPAVPRRSSPRTKVPAGSVGLADRFSGVYPRQGPGGWQLIGRTDAPLWDLDRTPPALLAPGARVRFRDLEARDLDG